MTSSSNHTVTLGKKVHLLQGAFLLYFSQCISLVWRLLYSFIFFVCSCLFPLAFHFMIFASRFPFPVLLCLRCAQCKVPTLSEIENFCRLFFHSCLNFYLACAIFNSSQCDCCCRCPAICLSVHLSISLSVSLPLLLPVTWLIFMGLWFLLLFEIII